MGFGSPIHWVLLAVVLILVLGGGRFSSMMSDVAKGVKNFKKGMNEEDETTSGPAARLDKPEGRQPNGAQRGAEPAFDRDGNKVRDDR